MCAYGSRAWHRLPKELGNPLADLGTWLYLGKRTELFLFCFFVYVDHYSSIFLAVLGLLRKQLSTICEIIDPLLFCKISLIPQHLSVPDHQRKFIINIPYYHLKKGLLENLHSRPAVMLHCQLLRQGKGGGGGVVWQSCHNAFYDLPLSFFSR